MIRRPRYPLTLRLAWMELELANAAKLLPRLIDDVRDMLDRTDDSEVRTLVVLSAVCAALLAVGFDPRTLDDLVRAAGPDGDLDEAEDIANGLVAEAILRGAPSEGEAD